MILLLIIMIIIVIVTIPYPEWSQQKQKARLVELLKHPGAQDDKAQYTIYYTIIYCTIL